MLYGILTYSNILSLQKSTACLQKKLKNISITQDKAILIQKKVYKILLEGGFELDLSTYEAINYMLNIRGDVKAGDEKYRGLIIRTLLRLPEEIRDKTLEETLFIIASPSISGTVFDLVFPEQRTIHCILLNFSSMGRMGDSRKMDVIAHEIAHNVLGHESISGYGSQDKEKEADDLIQTWGFKKALLARALGIKERDPLEVGLTEHSMIEKKSSTE